MNNKLQTPQIQATSIEVEDWLGNLIIVAIYCPPRHIIKKSQFVDLFSSLGPKFIIGGDYNAKHPRWASRLTTPRGRVLARCMDNLNLGLATTGKPTY